MIVSIQRFVFGLVYIHQENVKFSSIIINNKQSIMNPTLPIVFANRHRVIEIKNHQREFERQLDLENLLKESNIQLQN